MGGKEMKNKVYKTIISLGIIIVILGLSVIMVNAQFINFEETPLITLYKSPETLDMLIFISPQYNLDNEIISVINNYIKAVKVDLGWNAKIIAITEANNDYEVIDQIIEDYYQKYEIKACIMVGEDTNTPLAGDCDYMEKPSTVPWFTIGGREAYEKTSQGIISKPYKMDICVSLLYPTHAQDYFSKKWQIINAFEKFGKQRNIDYLKEITVFESSEINANSKEIYQNIKNYSNLNYLEDTNYEKLETSLKKYHSMYFVHGHSNPAGTYINGNEKIWFSAENLDEIKSPFFGADGCYVAGWFSNQKDNNNLDSSISATYYGSKIFTSKYIKTMVLGLLSQNGYDYSVSFIENALPKLTEGITLAESVIGSSFTGDFIIIGDPTFHFNL